MSDGSSACDWTLVALGSIVARCRRSVHTWLSADPVFNQLANQKWPSHLSHRIASDFPTRLFRQGVAKVSEETRCEYLKDTGLDLARPMNA